MGLNCRPKSVELASPASDDQEGAIVLVDPALLHSGGSESQRAGDHAHRAAQRLSATELVPQMFGDFATAETFHEAAGSAWTHHTRLLLEHRSFFGLVGRGASMAAAGFADMEEDNSASVRAVWCNSAT
ncbi:hypothetical protein AWC08_18435 [Mycobacterium gordonae]|uniref:Uncharacterized protein n=1 Tax=Mycobacterium gordonae TaxID=1778 RepID=A0A1X1X352_MYCGO|nr:hypothetical protein AWC08_18435 [Mycobacterium gordonae]